jgi:hypothetical protein
MFRIGYYHGENRGTDRKTPLQRLKRNGQGERRTGASNQSANHVAPHGVPGSCSYIVWDREKDEHGGANGGHENPVCDYVQTPHHDEQYQCGQSALEQIVLLVFPEIRIDDVKLDSDSPLILMDVI